MPDARPRRIGAVLAGVLGEVLLTLGLLVGLYAVWEFWIDDAGARVGQEQTATALVDGWDAEPADPGNGTDPTPRPPVTRQPDDGESFAVLHVPRFGGGWQRPVLDGTSAAELEQGVGWYPGTQLPGERGNFAVAGHRTTHGSPFGGIADLRVGDPIVVETRDGWYVYRFRNLEYVLPTGVDVLFPVPQRADERPTASVLTMTSCNPMFSATERIIAFSVFDEFVARGSGRPAALDGAA